VRNQLSAWRGAVRARGDTMERDGSAGASHRHYVGRRR
jgi:hypothetical protein